MLGGCWLLRANRRWGMAPTGEATNGATVSNQCNVSVRFSKIQPSPHVPSHAFACRFCRGRGGGGPPSRRCRPKAHPLARSPSGRRPLPRARAGFWPAPLARRGAAAARCGADRSGAERFSAALRRGAAGCGGMRCDAMRCDAMRCDAMRCRAARCSASLVHALSCARTRALFRMLPPEQ